MKKHKIAAILAAAVMLVSCMGTPICASAAVTDEASAAQVNIENSSTRSKDNLYSYETLDDGTIELTFYHPMSDPQKYPNIDLKKIVFPSEIDGKTVSGIRLNYMSFTQETADKVTEIVIPDSVKSLGYRAFALFHGLKKITLSKNLESLGEYAFYESGLESIELPDSLKEIGYDCFSYTPLKSIAIPASVKTIGDDAFRSCAELSKVDLSKCTANFNKRVFNSCTALKEITIPNTVASMGNSQFTGCTNLKKVNIGISVTSSIFNNSTIEEVNVTSGASVIEDDAFRNLTALKKVTLPSTLKKIGQYAFYKSGIETAAIPDSVTEIGYSCFHDSAIRSISIPASVKTIGQSTFWGCEQLKNIDLSKCTAALPDNMLWGCTSLEKVVIPSTVPSIGTFCFNSCTNLKSVSIYSPVIGDSVCYGCKSLKEVILGDTVSDIVDFNYFYMQRGTLYVYPGTYAEQYLKSHNCKYNYIFAEGSGPLLGDIDFSNSIESADALAALRYSVNLVEFNENQKRVADVTGDGNIDSADALDILRFSIGISSNRRIGIPT